MHKIEKQNIPVFFDEAGQPIAALLYLKGQKIIFTLKSASEEDIIDLYEKKDTLIKPIK